MEERKPVPASGLRSGWGSKVNHFFRVPTSVDTQHFIQIYARVFGIHLAHRQTNELGRADKNIYLFRCRR